MIREANDGDCINLAALSMDVWLQTYAIEGIRTESSTYVLSTFTEKYFKGVLREPNYRLFVYIDGVYLRGYTLVNLESQFESAENGFEIAKLYVHGPFQGNGIGRKLLSEVRARYGDRFWLYTWVRNKSIGFYKKNGFKEIGQYTFEFGSEMIENCVLGFGRT
ncbi:MAG: GNAT family N-acetyltransferase [Desulfobacterium sp.]|nr:GNAT family N-acetyltransferase [Desulfobacterium sp.]